MCHGLCIRLFPQRVVYKSFKLFYILGLSIGMSRAVTRFISTPSGLLNHLYLLYILGLRIGSGRFWLSHVVVANISMLTFNIRTL